MKKTFFDLNDDIVQNALDSLSFSAEKPVIVGGLAIQLHAFNKPDLLRDTPDADILIRDNLNYEDFLERHFNEPCNFLKSLDYHVQPKRGRGNNAIKLIDNPNKEDESNFLLNWTVFDEGVYSGMKDYIDRQIDFSRKIKYSDLRSPVRVACLEEVLPMKLQRAKRFGSGDREVLVGPAYSPMIQSACDCDWNYLAKIPLVDWKIIIERMQKNLGETFKRGKDGSETYKLSKDIYDICLGARVISDLGCYFDEDRYKENVSRIFDRQC